MGTFDTLEIEKKIEEAKERVSQRQVLPLEVKNRQIMEDSVTATEIAANTITASEIAANTITATEIAANTITASEIVAGTITATEMTVATLSSITANLGSITAGSMNAVTITSGTITGTTIKTSSSGTRVELTASQSSLELYDSGDDLVGYLDEDADSVNLTSFDGRDIFIWGNDDVYIDATDSIILRCSDDSSFFIYDGSAARQVKIDDDSGDTRIQVAGSAAKTAILPTSQGYNALYCMESPEVWFMDFCETKGNIDPLFEEVTVAPYKYIECTDGTYQVWGKRKDEKDLRFGTMTKEQFEANSNFWSKAHG